MHTRPTVFQTKQEKSLGIAAGMAYPVDEFRERARLGRAAYRNVRRSGLPVRRVGRRSFVLGADWLAFLASRPQQPQGGDRGGQQAPAEEVGW